MDPVAVTAARTANQRAYELAWLLGILRRQPPRRVLEVGVEAGGSLWAWCQVATDDARIMGIDCEWHSTAFTELIARHPWPARASQQLTLRKMDSQTPEAGLAARAYFTDGVDFLFIDADHSLEGVRSDWAMFSPLVVAGGIVGFHDIAGGVGVKDFWKELRPGRVTDQVIDPADHGMGIGVVYL